MAVSGAECRIGSIAQRAGGRCTFGIGTNVPNDFARAVARTKKVDLSLRPSADTAARAIDLTEYWTGDGPILLEQVPVKVEQAPPR
jgi:hypothetical protein